MPFTLQVNSGILFLLKFNSIQLYTTTTGCSYVRLLMCMQEKSRKIVDLDLKRCQLPLPPKHYEQDYLGYLSGKQFCPICHVHLYRFWFAPVPNSGQTIRCNTSLDAVLKLFNILHYAPLFLLT